MKQLSFPKKTFRQPGSKTEKGAWIEKPPSPVLTCACGKKYIKTREGQTECIPCIYVTAKPWLKKKK